MWENKLQKNSGPATRHKEKKSLNFSSLFSA